MDPALLAYARAVATRGVPARHGGTRKRVQARPHTSAKEHLDEVLGAFWKDTKQGRIFFCSSKREDLLQGVFCSPTSRVPKFNPDRTECAEGRVCLDQRGPNLDCHKEDHPNALQPRHMDVARVILWWHLRAPGIELGLAKKDVKDAFRWLWVCPEDVALFATEFEGPTIQEGVSFLAFDLALTFGFFRCSSGPRTIGR